jgi:hypothetical protein
VDFGYTTAVETSRIKWLRARSGTVIGADETGFVNWRRNWRTLCNKLKN